MKRLISILVMSVILTSAALSKTVAGRHKIELTNPTGDVLENDGKPGKDVVKVAIVSDGDSLRITAELKENVSEYLKDQIAGPVIEMHFNTDNNDKTGGIAFWGKNKKGFEYQVNLVACIRYENGGLGGLGDKITGFCSSYKLYRYNQDKKQPENINNALEVTQNDITGKEVAITLPYSEIGIKSGDRIRISIRESDSTFDDASYFPQVFFIVK
jgi:hypothetical protein